MKFKNFFSSFILLNFLFVTPTFLNKVDLQKVEDISVKSIKQDALIVDSDNNISNLNITTEAFDAVIEFDYTGHTNLYFAIEFISDNNDETKDYSNPIYEAVVGWNDDPNTSSSSDYVHPGHNTLSLSFDVLTTVPGTSKEDKVFLKDNTTYKLILSESSNYSNPDEYIFNTKKIKEVYDMRIEMKKDRLNYSFVYFQDIYEKGMHPSFEMTIIYDDNSTKIVNNIFTSSFNKNKYSIINKIYINENQKIKSIILEVNDLSPIHYIKTNLNPIDQKIIYIDDELISNFDKEINNIGYEYSTMQMIIIITISALIVFSFLVSFFWRRKNRGRYF